MTLATELGIMMLTNVTRTVRNKRMVTLLRDAEKKVDSINAVSGKTLKDHIEEYFEIFLSGEIKNFATSADFVVPFLFVPTRMEHFSWILQTNL